MTVLQERIMQLAVKIESAEGTPETLAAADAHHLLLGDNAAYSADPTMHDRPIVQESYSRHKQLVGVEQGAITAAVELRGSGAEDTAPSWDALLRSAGFAKSTVKKIPIGAITGGPFTHDETVTGGTSSATGRVIGDWATGVSHVYVVVLTGTFDVGGEVLTGGTSGATASSSAGVADGGFVYEPISTSIPSVTAALYHEGTRKAIAGARANVVIGGQVGAPMTLAFQWTGVDQGVTDASLLSVADTDYDQTVPPVIKAAPLSFDSFAPVYEAFSIDMQNTIALRTSGGATKGAVSARYTGRDPQITVNPEFDLVANFDFYGRLKGETLHQSILDIGSAAGNRFKIIVPQTQVRAVGSSERNGVSVVDLTCGAPGDFSWKDKEIALLCW